MHARDVIHIMCRRAPPSLDGLSDREIFEGLPVGDPWNDGDMYSVFCYLWQSPSTVVADSWLECMTQFPAETRQLVVADEALVVEYNNLVTSHAWSTYIVCHGGKCARFFCDRFADFLRSVWLGLRVFCARFADFCARFADFLRSVCGFLRSVCGYFALGLRIFALGLRVFCARFAGCLLQGLDDITHGPPSLGLSRIHYQFKIAACMAVKEFHIIDACIGLDCKNPTRKPSAKNPQTGRKNPQTGAIFFSARFVVLMCTIHDVWVQLLSILVQGDLRLSCTGYV